MVTTKQKYPRNYLAFREWQNTPQEIIDALEGFAWFFEHEFEDSKQPEIDMVNKAIEQYLKRTKTTKKEGEEEIIGDLERHNQIEFGMLDDWKRGVAQFSE